jgi:hypothetical protein
VILARWKCPRKKKLGGRDTVSVVEDGLKGFPN